jgi:hypothetical protein
MTMRKFFLLMLSVLMAMLCYTNVFATPMVSSGVDADADYFAGVRYRSFANTGGGEMYLGVPDLGVGANRSEINLTWASGPNSVSFSYDLTDLTSSADGEEIEYNIGNLGTLNRLQISVVSRDTDSSVSFENVYLGSELLGNFGGPGWNNWTVTDIDLSSGFMLTGDIILSGPFSASQELSKVEVLVGSGSPAPVPEPTTMLLLGTGLAGLAGFGRKKFKKN